MAYKAGDKVLCIEPLAFYSQVGEARYLRGKVYTVGLDIEKHHLDVAIQSRRRTNCSLTVADCFISACSLVRVLYDR